MNRVKHVGNLAFICCLLFLMLTQPQVLALPEPVTEGAEEADDGKTEENEAAEENGAAEETVRKRKGLEGHWVIRDGCRYYLTADGTRVHGWQRIDGLPYFFNENGALCSVFGPDLSEYEPDTDFKALKDLGCEFVYLRLGYRTQYGGNLYLDTTFDHHIQAAREAGLKVGVYFFSQALTKKEGAEEAQFVLDVLSDYGPVELPIAIDIEHIEGRVQDAALSRKAYTNVVLGFGEAIRKAGYQPMVYSYKSILEEEIDPEALEPAGIQTWYADYHALPDLYSYPFSLWQFTDVLSVSGVPTRIDMNALRLDCVGKAFQDQPVGSADPLPGEKTDPDAPDGPDTEAASLAENDSSADSSDVPKDSAGADRTETAGEIVFPKKGLSLGDSGEAVTVLQEYLAQAGYYYNHPNGSYGEFMQTVIAWFQKDLWLPVTGAVDEETWNVIKELAANVETVPEKMISPYVPEKVPVLRDLADLQMPYRFGWGRRSFLVSGKMKGSIER